MRTDLLLAAAMRLHPGPAQAGSGAFSGLVSVSHVVTVRF